MRIAVVGAGGMGSAYAAFLADAGQEVTLVGRRREYADAVNEQGLRVERPNGVISVSHPRATADPTTLAPASADVLVVLTKTFDSAIAIAQVAHILASNGIAISLQNGLGNERPLANQFGDARAYVGVTTVGAHLHEPGRITITESTAALASITQFGPATGSAHPDVQMNVQLRDTAHQFAKVCTDAGLPTTLHERIAEPIWAKLALAVMGPVSAVLRRSVMHTWKRYEAQFLIRSMFDEVIAVAHAEGVDLDAAETWAHSVRTYEGTGDHTTSMCTDILKRRPTEIEAMAGQVARRGAAHGIPTPVHNTICDLIRTIEATYDATPGGLE